MPDRNRIIEVSATETAKLIKYLSCQQGFIDFFAGNGRRFVSAWPHRSWSIPVDRSQFQSVIKEVNQAQQEMTRAATLSTSSATVDQVKQDVKGHRPAQPGIIAGILFYEAGMHTVPGFKPSKSLSYPELGHIGQYLWHLSVDAASGKGQLHVHPQCDDDDRFKIAALAEAPPETPSATFQLTEPFRADKAKSHHLKSVASILDLIRAGDCYQVNLSQRFTGQFKGSPYSGFKAMMNKIPVPFGAFVDAGPYQVLSISPELFLRLENNAVTSKPIKGTRPRSMDSSTDKSLAQELHHSVKDRAENLMIVDLIRNDLSHFCVPHSVKVPTLFGIESYENVHQLVSTVTGTLRSDTSALDALMSAFPGGSITGAPKRRSMEVIDHLEKHNRGPYCGSAFWWDSSGLLESNIAIRTLMTEQTGNIYCWGGGGIVADSDPEGEYEESLTKVRKLMDILQEM